MSVFPITFEDKVDSPELIAWLSTFGAEKKITAAEINLIRDALNELHNSKVPIVDGKIPSLYLPSYVDDVLEFADLVAFPATGETGKIYLALDTNFTYRWGGSVYVQIGGTAKKSQSLLFQVPTNGTALNNTQMNFCQSRFNGQSVFGSLGLVFGAGITETSGVISLSDFSDKATPEITPNYISKVKHIKMSYSRNVAESGANTNVVVRVMAESKYLVDMQLIAEYNLVSTTALGTQENKVDIPVLTHLDLSAYSNIKWCIRTNNATAQTFNFIRLNVDIEEV